MIRAAGKPDRMELAADGNQTIVLNENAMSFQLGEKTFKITRKGIFGAKFQLWFGEDLVVSNDTATRIERFDLSHQSGEPFALLVPATRRATPSTDS